MIVDLGCGPCHSPGHALMPEDLRPRFEAEYKAALRVAYPRKAWGTVLPFARVFVVAQRPAAV